MKRIVRIEGVKSWTKNGVKHSNTYAILLEDDGNEIEARGYGDDYKIGELVEAWFNEDWDYYQMQHKGGKHV